MHISGYHHNVNMNTSTHTPWYEHVLMSISEMVQQLHVQDASFLTIITKRYLQIG